MVMSRRFFVRSLGVTGAAALGAVRALPLGAEPQVGPSSTAPVPPGALKLDQNENPLGPGAHVSEAIAQAAKLGNRYPRNAVDLVAALAKHHGLERENVLLGLGSGELLRASVPAFTSPARPLVAGLPTFETCTLTARRMNIPVREVAVDKDLRLDLAGMDDAAGGAGLVFLCNPNNPTGTLVPTREVAALIDRVAARSPETVVLVDEAYHHYVEDRSYETLAPRAAHDRRVLVSRTFSKVHGLAGMRVGYAIGHRDTLELLRAQMTSGYLPVTSVAAALAALADEADTARQVSLNREARSFTRAFFEKAGCRVAESHANFLLVHVRRPAADFQRACREAGVLVGRPFAPLADWSRVGIGTADEMRRAVDVFAKVLGAPAKAA
jgi:histidinol-phosphate aminotransferase